MKESIYGYYLILFGITVFMFMVIINEMTTTNQQDYYMLKEITNASMIDSVNWGYYREYGEVRIDSQVFAEVFLRRFAQSVSKSNNYQIDIYSVYENPPSVNIVVKTDTGDFRINGTENKLDVFNSYDAILEVNNKTICDLDFISIPYSWYDSVGFNNDKDGYQRISNYQFLNTGDKIPKIVTDCFKEKLGAIQIDENPNCDKIDLSKLSKEERAQANSKLCLKRIKILQARYLKNISTNQEIEEYSKQYGEDSSTNIFDRARSVNDMAFTFPDENDEEFLAEDIKDVNIAAINDESGEGGYALSWSGKFKCGDGKNGRYSFGAEGSSVYNKVKSYRIKALPNETDENKKTIAAWEDKYKSDCLNSSPAEYGKIGCKYAEASEPFVSFYSDKDAYATCSSIDSDNCVDPDGNKVEGIFEPTPYFGVCMVGIKFKVIFYYDN